MLAILSCERRPTDVTIALAYARTTPGVGNVIADAIAEQQPPGAPHIAIFVPQGNEIRVDQGATERATVILRQPHLVGVVGHASSRESLIAAPIYAEAGVPLLVPTGTSRRLRNAGPWLLTLAPDDSAEGAYLARVADEKMLARSVTILYSNDEYGADLRDGVVTEMRRRGLRLIDQSPISDGIRCRAGALDAGAQALLDATLQRGVPDVMVLATRSAAAGCLLQALRRRHARVSVLSGDAVLPVPLLDAARSMGPSEAMTCGVTLWHRDVPDSASRAFVARFQRVMGKGPTVEQAMVFEGAMLIAQAVWAVGPSPGDVRDYLESLGRTRPAARGLRGRVALNGAGIPRLVAYCVHGDSTRMVDAP